jgi:hypothetical protein
MKCGTLVLTGPDAAMYIFLYKTGLDGDLCRIIPQGILQSNTVNVRHFFDCIRNVFPQTVL